MFKNKKGLSEVVTIVLIILIVVGVVAAIWLFIRPALTNTGSGLTKAQVCTSNVFEPISCVKDTTTGKAKVQVKRVATTLSPSALKVVSHAADQDNLGTESMLAPQADGLVQTKDTTAGSTGKAVDSVQVLAEYTLADGTKVSCTSNRITCT